MGIVKRFIVKATQSEIKKEVQERVNQEKVSWAKKTAEKITKSYSTLGRVKDYTTKDGTKFSASELTTEKRFGMLYEVYSEAPGSTQCADRIRSAVTGNGYILQPVPTGKKSKKELETLIEFFDRPNEDETIEDIVQSIVTNYYAFGNAYVEQVNEEKGEGDSKEQGEPQALYTLPSEDIRILVDAEKRKAGVNIPIGYQQYIPFAEGTTKADKTITYAIDDLMHFKRPDLRGRIYGRALFEDNQSVLQLILQALIYNIKTFQNGGKPPLQINLPEGTSSTEAIEFSHFFEKNFQGMHNAGKALITYNNAKASALGLTPQDIEYLQLLTFGLKQVGGMYGVPMIMISQPEGSNRATSFEETKSFYQRVVQPLRNYICNKITQDIIIDGFNFKDWRLDFQDIDLEDSKSRVEEASKSFMYGTRNWNEARKRMGLEAGSEPWMDEFFVVHNGIATPLKDFGSGKAKTQSDKKKEKEEKSVEKKNETVAEAKKNAKKENLEMNKGEIIDPERTENHKTHIEEHQKVVYTTKEKYRASVRMHIYAHEDHLYQQDGDGGYGRVSSDKK